MEGLVYIALFTPLLSSLFAGSFAMTPKKQFIGVISSFLLFTSFVASA
ncbi:MAG: hypothetical protein IE887_10890, partial [Campylobacterales bacterium]|nr:hypothetical protein [Campylobacterales bacterium]